MLAAEPQGKSRRQHQKQSQTAREQALPPSGGTTENPLHPLPGVNKRERAHPLRRFFAAQGRQLQQPENRPGIFFAGDRSRQAAKRMFVAVGFTVEGEVFPAQQTSGLNQCRTQTKSKIR